MPVKIEPRKPRGPRIIGDWSRQVFISDPPDAERRALRIEKNPVKIKHAKIPPQRIDPLVKIRMKKNIPASLDGIHSQELKEGKIYEMSESLARPFIEKSLAIKIKETKKGDKK